MCGDERIGVRLWVWVVLVEGFERLCDLVMVLHRLPEDLHTTIFLDVEPSCHAHVNVTCEAGEVLVQVHDVVQGSRHDVVHLV